MFFPMQHQTLTRPAGRMPLTSPLTVSVTNGHPKERRPLLGNVCAVAPPRETSAQVVGVQRLKETVRRVIDEFRVTVPGWGLLSPGTVLGDYRAENAYLLLVFDAQGQPHATRLAVKEVEQFEHQNLVAEARLREVIVSLSPASGCSPTRGGQPHPDPQVEQVPALRCRSGEHRLAVAGPQRFASP